VVLYRGALVELELLEPEHFVVTNYTGKLVKSILIEANPELKGVFGGRGLDPKPVHISPILVRRRRLEAAYPKILVKEAFKPDVRPQDSRRAVIIKRGEPTAFYIGYREDVEHLVAHAISSLSQPIEIIFGGSRLVARAKGFRYTASFDTEDSDPLPWLGEQGARAVIIRMVSPVLPRDPFTPRGATSGTAERRYRRLVPAVPYLFSVNAYELARIARAQGSRKMVWELLAKISAGLREHHTTVHTVGKVWYLDDGEWLPALTGSIKLFITSWADLKLVKQILAHAAIMGIGTGRAAGFGHIEVEPSESLE